MEKKGTFLIATNQLQRISGSELNALDLAIYLHSQGFEVTLTSFIHGSPIAEIIERHQLSYRNLTTYTIDDSPRHYDFLISQHISTIDYLVFKTNMSFGKIWHRSLSTTEPLETLPIYSQHLKTVYVISPEIKEFYTENYPNISPESIEIVPNFVPADFFEVKRQAKEFNVAIISNHPPEELIRLQSYCEKYFPEVKIKIFGRTHNVELISPEIIANYSAVISIGRSVLYALAAKIPVYVYDRYGGDGWLTPKNYEKSKEANFSGRFLREKLPTEDICRQILEIKEGRIFTTSMLSELQQKCKTDFHISKFIKSLEELKCKQENLKLATIRKTFTQVEAYSDIFLKYYISQEKLRNRIQLVEENYNRQKKFVKQLHKDRDRYRKQLNKVLGNGK